MKHRAYVPIVIRELISDRIKGSSTSLYGLEKKVADLRKSIETIHASSGRQRDDFREWQTTFLLDVADLLKEKTRELEVWKRLGDDFRMKDVYRILQDAFGANGDDKLRCFIISSVEADLNYQRIRDRNTRTTDLKNALSEKLRSAAGLYRDLQKTEVSLPREIVSLESLLLETDSTRFQDIGTRKWQSLRPLAFGATPQVDIYSMGIASEDQPVESQLPVNEVSPEPPFYTEREILNRVSNAWGFAPSVPDVLESLADKVRGFQPKETGMIKAAVKPRQHNEKTAYIRAFLVLLAESGMEFTSQVEQAIALTTNVVMSDLGIDATTAEVQRLRRS